MNKSILHASIAVTTTALLSVLITLAPLNTRAVEPSVLTAVAVPQDSDVDDSAVDPAEAIRHLNAADKELTKFEKNLPRYRSSLSSCERKRVSQKRSCSAGVIRKMAVSLRALCAYDDVLDLACDELSADDTQGFFAAFDENFFEDAHQSIDDELSSLSSDESDADSSVQEPECFDHNYKTYLSDHCIQLRKSQGLR